MISPRPISAWLSLAPQSSHLPVEQKSLLPSAAEKQKNNETPWLSAKHVSTAATAPRKSVWGSSIVVSNHPCNPQQPRSKTSILRAEAQLRSEGAIMQLCNTSWVFVVRSFVEQTLHSAEGSGVKPAEELDYQSPRYTANSKLKGQLTSIIHRLPRLPPVTSKNSRVAASQTVESEVLRANWRYIWSASPTEITISHESGTTNSTYHLSSCTQRMERNGWIESGSFSLKIMINL